MRDYSKFDEYYQELLRDIYPQPPDVWHSQQMRYIVERWIPKIGASSVLDVGCGEGDAQPIFKGLGIAYTGVAIGEDVRKGIAAGRNVFDSDFNFLNYGDESFDLIFSRHSLEHSPFPLLTLMEWHRVSKRWLCVIMPNPSYTTWSGRNHYSVAEPRQIAFLLRRAGWRLMRVRLTGKEFQFLCIKCPRISYEGYVKVPIHNKIYEFERDKLRVNGVDMDVSNFTDV